MMDLLDLPDPALQRASQNTDTGETATCTEEHTLVLGDMG